MSCERESLFPGTGARIVLGFICCLRYLPKDRAVGHWEKNKASGRKTSSYSIPCSHCWLGVCVIHSYLCEMALMGISVKEADRGGYAAGV